MRMRNPQDLDPGPRLERNLTLPLRTPQRVYTSGWNSEVNFAKLNNGKKSGAVVKNAINIDTTAIDLQRTEDQFQSPLFQLPLEVRRQIYEEVLGGYVIHIYFVQAYRRLSHIRCKDRSPLCKGTTCRTRHKVPGAKDPWGNISLLHMLQSCRRMLVYSTPYVLSYYGRPRERD